VAVVRWFVGCRVGFIPALKGGAFSSNFRNRTITRADQVRFTIGPPVSIWTSAIDGTRGTFVVTRQQWNGSTWVDVRTARVSWTELQGYDFGDFPRIDEDSLSPIGFTLADLTTGLDAGYELDPVPVALSETGAASTEYTIRAVALAPSRPGATGTVTTWLAPGSTNASVDVPLDVSSCPLPPVALRYDRDDDCAITLTELGEAATDFSDGDLTLPQLGVVSSAFADS